MINSLFKVTQNETLKPPPLPVLSTVQWRHNKRYGVSNHRRIDCLLTFFSGVDQRKNQSNMLRYKTCLDTKPVLYQDRFCSLTLYVTGLCVGNSPVTGEFPAQRASNAEKVSVWWRYHERYSPRAVQWCGYMCECILCTVIFVWLMQHWRYQSWLFYL